MSRSDKQELHRLVADEDVLDRLASMTLQGAVFSHEAHLRLTYLLLERYGMEAGRQKIYERILAYVTQLGAARKYNVTVTMAGVQIVERSRKESTVTTFDELLAFAPRSKTDFKGLLAEYYSTHIFTPMKMPRRPIFPQI